MTGSASKQATFGLVPRRQNPVHRSTVRPAPTPPFSEEGAGELKKCPTRSQDSRHVVLVPPLTSKVILDKPAPLGRKTGLQPPFQNCFKGQIK